MNWNKLFILGTHYEYRSAEYLGDGGVHRVHLILELGGRLSGVEKIQLYRSVVYDDGRLARYARQ